MRLTTQTQTWPNLRRKESSPTIVFLFFKQIPTVLQSNKSLLQRNTRVRDEKQQRDPHANNTTHLWQWKKKTAHEREEIFQMAILSPRKCACGSAWQQGNFCPVEQNGKKMRARAAGSNTNVQDNLCQCHRGLVVVVHFVCRSSFTARSLRRSRILTGAFSAKLAGRKSWVTLFQTESFVASCRLACASLLFLCGECDPVLHPPLQHS